MCEGGLVGRLVSAVRAGDAEAVRALLEEGASPNAVDTDGLPVLCAAVAAYDAPVAEVLVQGGATPTGRCPTERPRCDVPLTAAPRRFSRRYWATSPGPGRHSKDQRVPGREGRRQPSPTTRQVSEPLRPRAVDSHRSCQFSQPTPPHRNVARPPKGRSNAHRAA
ncbi:hypothetical protein ACWCPS_38075 [Streptomyces mauvecolor]